jgi:hypothetical protein
MEQGYHVLLFASPSLQKAKLAFSVWRGILLRLEKKLPADYHFLY